jgi:biotin carboxyl carrier protein
MTGRRSPQGAVRVSLLEGDLSAGQAVVLARSGADGDVLVDGQPVDRRISGAGEDWVVVDSAMAGPVSARATAATSVAPSSSRESSRRLVLVGTPSQTTVRGRIQREIVVDGWRFDVAIEPERLAALRERATRGGAAVAASGPLDVRAIIPGRIVALSVVPGDVVTSDQQLLVLEAMKMQNELRAPRDGTVRSVAVGVGDRVEVGDVLLVLE